MITLPETRVQRQRLLTINIRKYELSPMNFSFIQGAISLRVAKTNSLTNTDKLRLEKLAQSVVKDLGGRKEFFSYLYDKLS